VVIILGTLNFSKMDRHLFQVLVVLTLSGLAFGSCKSQQMESNNGTLAGNLGLLEGNCMPGPGRPPCEPAPISGTIYITKPSERYQADLLIRKVDVSEDGLFSVKLEPGKYSVFVQDGDQITCTITNCPDQCYCLLVEIVDTKVTNQDVTINHATW